MTEALASGWSLPINRRVPMATVRRWVYDHLSGLVERARIDDVVLVVVELVTNAYLHAGVPVELRLAVDAGAVEVEVADHDPTIPKIRASAGRHGGNGLVIVAKLAAEWGVRPAELGKAVWARM
jgi:anti-sigma regulatory factor (Ser/Thr protein kinase)